MIAGKMREKIELLRPVTVRDRFGSNSTTYEATVTARAERRKLTGQMREELGEHFPAYSAEFNIRIYHEVDEHWRIRVTGGHLFEVTNVIPNRDRGFQTLICSRVNE